MAMTPPRDSGFKANPQYRITFERSPRRVCVRFNGAIVADSTNAHLLFETRHLPVKNSVAASPRAAATAGDRRRGRNARTSP
ncbi:MAG TPA: hypothetical protein VGL83_07040 [Stellaceae bacterium]|jgi:uncharacterized protein (DUF427 family)